MSRCIHVLLPITDLWSGFTGEKHPKFTADQNGPPAAFFTVGIFGNSPISIRVAVRRTVNGHETLDSKGEAFVVTGRPASVWWRWQGYRGGSMGAIFAESKEPHAVPHACGYMSWAHHGAEARKTSGCASQSTSFHGRECRVSHLHIFMLHSAGILVPIYSCAACPSPLDPK